MRTWQFGLAGIVVGCSSSPSSTSPPPGDAGPEASVDGASVDAAIKADAAPTMDSGPDAGNLPSGWLYTQGSTLYLSDGNGGGTQWMGRGVNMDDLFLCGYDDSLWMTNAQSTLTSIASGLVTAWKPSFVRVSLAMKSYAETVSFTSDPAQYATPMTQLIDSIGAHPGVYVLVTLRSDASMIDQDSAGGDPEATGLPSSATDPTYVALVDAFASSPFVLFGLSNEPGGNTLSDATIRAAMDHAVQTIRNEEDKLGVPHHIVSVQGNSWTSDIGFYATTPLGEDDVVYEVHGYPPTPAMYTYSNIPVIIGEYGSLTNAASFFADVESKQIPNLAWDFEPYSDCAPELLVVNESATDLVPTTWGTTVQSYLTSP